MTQYWNLGKIMDNKVDTSELLEMVTYSIISNSNESLQEHELLLCKAFSNWPTMTFAVFITDLVSILNRKDPNLTRLLVITVQETIKTIDKGDGK